MAKLPLVSIIVTTYNRPKYLSMCLEALAFQTLDDGTYEIVIVDNNSNDNTKDVINDFINTHSNLNIHYHFDSRQGVSFARNSGILASSGEFLFFVDDDIKPFPSWSEALFDAFTNSDVGCVGGPMILDYQNQEVPFFLQGDLQSVIGYYKLPYGKPTPVSLTELPWGGNMGFRRCVFSEVGLFRTDLGPIANKRLTGEETELMFRLQKRGWTILYIPEAKVDHVVPKERLSKSYLYYVARGFAASHVISTTKSCPFVFLRWLSSDLWYATRMFYKFLLAVLRRKSHWFDDYYRFWVIADRIPLRFKMLFTNIITNN